MPETTNVASFEPIQQLLTIRQTARALQLSERTVAAMVATGNLPSIQIGRARRISADALKSLATTGAAVGRKRS